MRVFFIGWYLVSGVDGFFFGCFLIVLKCVYWDLFFFVFGNYCRFVFYDIRFGYVESFMNLKFE